MALQVRPDQRVAAPRIRLQRLIARGHLVFVARRQHQQFDTGALVDAEQSTILERLLPDIDDVGVERAVYTCRRNLDHDRPNIPGVEEGHEIQRVGIGRQRLVLPVQRLAPIDHLVHFPWRLGQHFLQHEIVVDDGHAPDHSLDSAAARKTIVRRRRLGNSKNR